jgi:hypothetical protein
MAGLAAWPAVVTRALFGVALIALGAGLEPLTMMGLVGLPLLLVGGGLLTSAATGARGEADVPRWKNALGVLLEIGAGFGLLVSALYSASLAWKHQLGFQRPGTALYRVSAHEVIVAIVLWLVLPTLLTLGIRLRTQWEVSRLLGWWVLTLAAPLAAVLSFLVLAASGAPLSA